MRVKELADLTGTTVRTIRHYHQIGLLPVPEQPGGVRDYRMAHLARLVRIRWLVGSGVPLAAVRSMLEEAGSAPDERVTIRTDLAETLSAVDERIAELSRQREQLINLLHTTAEGGPVSPMPRPVRVMYDRLMERARDDEVATLISAERQVVEFACYRGELPPVVIELADRLTDAQLDLIIPMFIEFRDLTRQMTTLPAAELDRRVDEMAEHAVQFVASLDLAPRVIVELLEQMSMSSGAYVGYATTELFPKELQVRFQRVMEDGLRRQSLLPGDVEGARR